MAVGNVAAKEMKTRDLGEPPTPTSATHDGRMDWRIKPSVLNLQRKLQGFFMVYLRVKVEPRPTTRVLVSSIPANMFRLRLGYTEEQTDSRTRSITRSEPVYSKGQTISD